MASKKTSLSGSLATLVKRAKGSDIYEAHEAMSEIVALGAKAAPARDEMLALVADKEPRRSLGARAVLANLDVDRDAHLDALLLAANGKDKSIARTIMWNLPGELLAPAITRALGATKPAHRLTALVMASSIPAFRKAVPMASLLPLLGDKDEKVREAAIHGVHMQIAPGAPAKPTAELTPAIRAQIAKLCKDGSKPVAARAKRFIDELAK